MPKSRSSFKPFDYQTLVRFSLGLFIFVGFLSSTFLVNLNQDVRNQAMIDDGIVEVRSQTIPSNQISQGQTTQIALQVNTNNVAIVGTQFIINVESSPSFAPLTTDQITIPSQSGLEPIYKKVEDLGGGSYEIQLSLRPRGEISKDLQYSNNNFVTIVQFPVTATDSSGQMNFSYDPEMSYILDGESADVMKTASAFTVNTVENPQPTVSTPPGKPTSTPRPTKKPAVTRDPRITRRPAQRPPFFYPRSKFRRKVRQYLRDRDTNWSWWNWRRDHDNDR